MPDTIRTLSELNQLFSDVGGVPVSPQELRDLFASLLVHGEIGSGSKAAITLTAGYQAMDFSVAGAISRGLTIDTANKRITGIPVNIGAEVTLEVLLTGAVNTTYDFAVIKNGSPVARLSGSARVVTVVQGASISMSSSLDLAAGDVLQAAVRPATGTPTFTLLRGVLRVRRIGIE